MWGEQGPPHPKTCPPRYRHKVSRFDQASQSSKGSKPHPSSVGHLTLNDFPQPDGEVTHRGRKLPAGIRSHLRPRTGELRQPGCGCLHGFLNRFSHVPVPVSSGSLPSSTLPANGSRGYFSKG